MRDALAIHRAMAMVSHFRPESHVTRTQWASYLEELYCQCFTRIYAERGSEERTSALGEIFSDFTTEFVDANGFFISSSLERSALLLARLYQQLTAAAIFPYGNSLALRLFFTLMGEMRGFREKLGGIDFRRLSSEEVEVLRDPAAKEERLAEVFLSAMTRARDPVYPGQLQPFPGWEDNSVAIHGLRYLQLLPDSERVTLWQKTEEPLIVLLNGRLVPRSLFCELLDAHRNSGEPLGAWRIHKSAWIGCLAQLKDSFTAKATIDGIGVSETAPPLCLSLHPFTQFTYPQHQRLEKYLQREYGKNVMALEDTQWAREVVQRLEKEEPKTAVMVQMAAQRIQRIAQELRRGITEELAWQQREVKSTEGQPHFVMTMGGSGSGKNSTRYFRQHFKSPNYVIASLDGGRAENDIFHLLIAAGHHADDYEAVHLWADTRRNWLCDAARAKRMNVIYDGSGIDYAGRYDRIVAEFKAAGYRTEVMATDCMLVVPPARQKEFPDSAIERIIRRARKRTLPWRVALNKHIGFATSLLAACSDTKLDRLILIDNAGPQGTDSAIAELFTVKEATIRQLEKAAEEGELLPMLAKHQLLPSEQKESKLTERNVGFLKTGQRRVLVIVNISRFVDILEKSQLNPNAHSPEALTWLKRTASFLIDRMDKPDGIPTIPPKKEGTKKAANQPRSNYLRLNSGKG